MTKDDKQFFRGLIYDLEQRIDQKWDKKFHILKTELQQDIRSNGFLIEQMQGEVSFLAGKIHDVKGDIKIMKKDISEIKEGLPVIKSVINKHSKQLALLTN